MDTPAETDKDEVDRAICGTARLLIAGHGGVLARLADDNGPLQDMAEAIIQDADLPALDGYVQGDPGTPPGGPPA